LPGGKKREATMVSLRSNRVAAWPVVLLAAIAAGCGVEKSENPLSPSIAGPIAGVEISAPRASEPAPGAKIRASQQPVRLMVENANSNGVRPLSYTFEVASDSAFQNKVFGRSNVTPGTNGRTTVTLDPLVIGKTYHWRARAEDGANTGPFMTAAFDVLPQPELDAPLPVSPIDNQPAGSLRPTLLMNAPHRNAAVGPLIYDLQIALDVAISQVISIGRFPEAGGQSTFTPTSDLPPNRQYYWRVRAGDGEATSVWSATQTFTTGGAPTPAPTPNPGPPPGGPCNGSNPETIVSCERAKYGGMSHSQMFTFMQSVAKSLNRNGIAEGPFGILRKAGGENCNGYSCDVVCAGQGGGQRQWDVLGDINGAQTPGWRRIEGSIRVDVCEIQ
jgi:hypothetical protein